MKDNIIRVLCSLENSVSGQAQALPTPQLPLVDEGGKTFGCFFRRHQAFLSGVSLTNRHPGSRTVLFKKVISPQAFPVKGEPFGALV